MVLRRWIIRWAGYLLGLLVVANVAPEVVRFAEPSLVVPAALIMMVVDVTVKPILYLIALPFSLITMGIFSLCINAWMLMLSAGLLPGFEISSFWGALLASLFILLISRIVRSLFRLEKIEVS